MKLLYVFFFGVLLLPASALAQQCPTCANFNLEIGEECDDGNFDTGDGCDASCQIEPNVWRCPPQWEGDGFCDCGCGIPDTADCVGSFIQACEYCSCGGLSGVCPGTVDPVATHECLSVGVWRCQEWHYGTNDGCDCGCGIPDPDCADATSASCEYCEYPESCSAPDCSEISSSDNSVCDCP